ncbi:MAG: hypothetical protein DMG72_02875 [Acidobacteria bacterium]|nr:MAG: hypothetical protein DMG72_02875 [Acidobacteriota bacterium]
MPRGCKFGSCRGVCGAFRNPDSRISSPSVVTGGSHFSRRPRRTFEGPPVEQVDERFDYGELRIYAIGLVNGLEITVVYSDRSEDERRIISAWRSEAHERRYYWQNVES